MTADEILEKLGRYAAGEGGLELSLKKKGLQVSVMGVFGREAPDSPMAGGALHGLGATVKEALVDALDF